MTEARTTCHTPTPGKKPTSIPTWKYHAIRAVILKIVPRREPGIPAKELPTMVASELSAEVKERLGSIAWHTTTVKLNMEVDGELYRIQGTKPQHLIRAA